MAPTEGEYRHQFFSETGKDSFKHEMEYKSFRENKELIIAHKQVLEEWGKDGKKVIESFNSNSTLEKIVVIAIVIVMVVMSALGGIEYVIYGLCAMILLLPLIFFTLKERLVF